MKGMILAAGLGTRLKPITNIMPKALVKVNGITLLERAILKLQKADIEEIIINVHHFADQIEYFLSNNDFGVKIHISDERDMIRGSGGALKHARKFLEGNGPFIVYNVDVISNIDLLDMMYLYQNSKALAILAVRKRETDRLLCFNDTHRLCGWKNKVTGEQKGQDGHEFAFSGIQLVHPELLKHMPNGNFSIIDFYIETAKTETILAYDHSDGDWMDVGTPERLKKAVKSKL
ncbi:MAG: nucleotidyltransferase family protein [Candidatus Marinimicrobia bacterium]|nr:nucleotidyltransferase family protein [Candidatus Neomarinimicrobiota bacterium]